ncbi:MAG TPA: hypothetical protein VKA92_09505, partial [Segetibacter sp.]|nr:hypothetical protein [Segetibacter sp.]
MLKNPKSDPSGIYPVVYTLIFSFVGSKSSALVLAVSAASAIIRLSNTLKLSPSPVKTIRVSASALNEIVNRKFLLPSHFVYTRVLICIMI